MTKQAPETNSSLGIKSLRIKYETKEVIIIEAELANSFNILSAYVITVATIKPPIAF